MPVTHPKVVSVSKITVLLAVVTLLNACGVAGYPVADTPPLTAASQTEIDAFLQKTELLDVTPSLLRELHESRAVDLEAVAARQSEREAYKHVIAPGNTLRIIIWRHPEFTIDLRRLDQINNFNQAINNSNVGGAQWTNGTMVVPVSVDGTITVPLVGEIEVSNLTTNEARELLRKELAVYIEDPVVWMVVAEYAGSYAYVSGASGDQGDFRITLEEIPTTILDVVTQLQQINPEAALQQTVLQRNGERIDIDLEALLVRGDYSQNYVLEPDDHLFFFAERYNTAYVLSPRGSLQAINLSRGDFSLANALSASSVLGVGYDWSRMVVFRQPLLTNDQSEERAKIFRFDISQGARFVLAQSFYLEPNDIIWVPPTSLGTWNDIIRLFVPTLNAAEDVRRIGNN